MWECLTRTGSRSGLARTQQRPRGRWQQDRQLLATRELSLWAEAGHDQCSSYCKVCQRIKSPAWHVTFEHGPQWTFKRASFRNRIATMVYEAPYYGRRHGWSSWAHPLSSQPTFAVGSPLSFCRKENRGSEHLSHLSKVTELVSNKPKIQIF